jgi:trypsin
LIEKPSKVNGFLTYENDVSLVQVQSNIVFSSTVQPIALSSNFIGGGVNVIISGYGLANDADTVFNDALQYLRTTTLTNADSQSRMPEFMEGEITERTFCTFLGTGQGICRGVTGAAVVHNNALSGLVSFGQIRATCGQFPDCHVSFALKIG